MFCILLLVGKYSRVYRYTSSCRHITSCVERNQKEPMPLINSNTCTVLTDSQREPPMFGSKNVIIDMFFSNEYRKNNDVLSSND